MHCYCNCIIVCIPKILKTKYPCFISRKEWFKSTSNDLPYDTNCNDTNDTNGYENECYCEGAVKLYVFVSARIISDNKIDLKELGNKNKHTKQ